MNFVDLPRMAEQFSAMKSGCQFSAKQQGKWAYGLPQGHAAKPESRAQRSKPACSCKQAAHLFSGLSPQYQEILKHFKEPP